MIELACREVEPYLDTFVDNELAQPECMEIELHLARCEACRRHTQHSVALKAALKAVAGPPAPPVMRAQVLRLLDEKDKKMDQQRRSALLAPYGGRRGMTLLAAALVLAVLVPGAFLTGYLGPSRSLLVDSIARSNRLPPDVTGDSQAVLSWFDGKVPFAVRAPRLEPIAALKGGRLINLDNREAALLIYEGRGNGPYGAAGQKIGVFIFDPYGLSFSTQRRHVIGRHEVFLEGTRGYNVALFQDRGLGYAISGPIDEPDLIRLISSAVSGR